MSLTIAIALTFIGLITRWGNRHVRSLWIESIKEKAVKAGATPGENGKLKLKLKLKGEEATVHAYASVFFFVFVPVCHRLLTFSGIALMLWVLFGTL